MVFPLVFTLHKCMLALSRYFRVCGHQFGVREETSGILRLRPRRQFPKESVHQRGEITSNTGEITLKIGEITPNTDEITLKIGEWLHLGNIRIGNIHLGSENIRRGAGNIRRSSGNILACFGEYSARFREHAVRFGEHFGAARGTFRRGSGNIPTLLGNILRILRNIYGALRLGDLSIPVRPHFVDPCGPLLCKYESV
jgi:hypothetical protein